ncbi:MAG: capsule assembly Wzi family protein [candidate division KSB1 bacterium]|nr:capsule assembly Wzi family protein [candidate division KSB1 bacterium]
MKPLLILLMTALFAYGGTTANLPLSHWAYPFFERLEALGVINGMELRVRPVSRQIAAEWVRQSLEAAKKSPHLFSAGDLKLLEQLRGDFRDELGESAADAAPERHFYTMREQETILHVDILAAEQIDSRRSSGAPDQLLSHTTLGGNLRGQFGNNLAFFANARNTLTRGEKRDPNDENFNPAKGEPVVTSGANVYRDQTTAYFIWQKSAFRLQAGKDEFDWGPFFGKGFALSANAPPADMLRLCFRLKKFSFNSMHAWLRSPLGQKYLAAHRIDLQPLQGLSLGFAETVVYGGRGVEPSYLNPLIFYHFAEHHLGDRDNNNIVADVVVTALPRLTLAGEWYIDDMTSTKSWRNYFGNKFAWAVGGLWADAFRLRGLDLRFRYGQISPYVYSHWDSLNIYTHYDQIIGNRSGPNSDEFSIALGKQFGRDFRIELNGRLGRKGAGEADTSTRPPVGDRKEFLKGVVERRSSVGFRIIDQLVRDLFVSISYDYEDVRNADLVAGRSQSHHWVRFRIDCDY